MSSKNKILKLYKALLRESQKFSAYNFREYSRRRVQDAFRENKNLTEKPLIQTQLIDAAKNLDIIKRQVILGQLYTTEKLVIENILK